MNNNKQQVLSGGYSKGNFGGAMKFKGPHADDPNTDNPTKEKIAAEDKIKNNPEFSIESPPPAGSSTLGIEAVGRAGKVFASYDQHLPNSNIKTGVTNTTLGKNKTRTKLHGAGTDEREAVLNSIPGSSTKKEAQKKVDDSSLKKKKDIIIRRGNAQMSFKPGGANKYKKQI